MEILEQHPSLPIVPLRHHPIRVLLVEDDPAAVELVRLRLASHNDQDFVIEWTPGLYQAVKRLARPDLDVILLDLGLPEVNGYQTYLSIRSAAAQILPIVVLTADERPVSRHVSVSRGASAYFIKSRVSSLELRSALRNAVRGFH